MADREYVELRSEDVQEILGTPPGWLVRWGTTIVLLGFCMLLTAAWFVRYPDVVEAKVVVTTATPPVDVMARADGRIAKLLITDTALVSTNQLLAVLQSTANYEDVLFLDSCLGAWQQLKIESFRTVDQPDSLTLGELQGDYADFVRILSDFKFGRDSRSASVQSNINSIQMQISQLKQSIAFEEKALKRTNDQLKTAEELYQKQKDLYEQGITSRVDFEKERTKLADLERQRDLYEENTLQKRREIISLQNNINSASFGQQETASSASSRLSGSLNTLRSNVSKWKQTYLLQSPIQGKVSLNGLTAQQYVRQGDQLITVVPLENDKIIGRVSLPIAGSGKVKEKQRVILKLDNYPYYEFGTISGLIISKSPVPKDNQYSILVALPVNKNNSLRTSYGKEIQFEQQLQGKAEIITDDKGFLQRISEQIFASVRR
ncbi:MAG TPA: HlyD family efflux transporter periplasmic adaptor subunit [Saprospiraceae bacterium]|nr:HlyD family efflux transporter periplasmic adaptor subunit [Saprospiraceae bacterium]HPI05131.1 HlyD family efflux transporter periplasmic adaptor subunit [Saprospiraceae bacterium]